HGAGPGCNLEASSAVVFGCRRPQPEKTTAEDAEDAEGPDPLCPPCPLWLSSSGAYLAAGPAATMVTNCGLAARGRRVGVVRELWPAFRRRKRPPQRAQRAQREARRRPVNAYGRGPSQRSRPMRAARATSASSVR